MKSIVTLQVSDLTTKQKQDLLSIFKLEDKMFSERAKYSLLQKNEDLIFSITAQDAVALRAVLNAISKTLSIYERTKKIVDENE